jgi:hypothetical protein
MIPFVLAVTVLALQSANVPCRQQPDASRAATTDRKQPSKNYKPGRPRLVHPSADNQSQQVRLMSLVPRTPSFSLVGIEKGNDRDPGQAGQAGQGAGVDAASLKTSASTQGAIQNRRGGLWLSGDVREGMARLAWIAGPTNAGLLSVDKSGQVRIDDKLLAKEAEASRPSGQSPALALSIYILSNEGLLLLEQLIQGDRAYRLHIGDRVLTLGGEVAVKSVLNLDNNFDGRINSYRPRGIKMLNERPPRGVDALISINPDVVWYSLDYRKVISSGIVTFHELAEAYAKVECDLEYLPNGLLPGAHSLAVQREFRLQAQRPELYHAITAGENLSINPALESRKHSTRLTALLEPTK